MSTVQKPFSQMTPSEQLAYVAALEANQKPVVKERDMTNSGLGLRVAEKGGICIYGLHNRFPVTLYREQFERLVAAIPEIQAWIVANQSKLATKPKKGA